MDKKTKMADGVPSWNIRTKNDEFTIDTIVFKNEYINSDISDELKKRLSSMSRYVGKNLLWSEMNTMKSVIYKHHNQHRKEKYLQGVKRIQKHLARLSEMKLEKLLSSFVEKMPKKDSNSTVINSYPSVKAIEYVLFKFMGAAKLITQTVGHCKSTMNYVGGQLSKGFFITFHIVNAAYLSRICVLLKDFLQNILECYEKLYPWLGLLLETFQGDRKMKSDLPTCLKTWIITTDHDNTLFERQKRNCNPEPATPQTSIVLEKLFSFTPASEQSMSELVTTSLLNANCADDTQSPDQLGDSFDASLNSTGRLLDTSEPVPRELFKDVSGSNTTMTLEECGMKHKLKPDIELQPYKRLHLDQDANSCTIIEKNNVHLLKEISYRVMCCPKKKLRHLTSYGIFKMPCMRTKRIINNPKMFESKVKRKRPQGKDDIEQLKKGKTRHPNYKRKRIFLDGISKSKHKRIFREEKKYHSRWKKKISLIIGQRKLKLLKNQNSPSWSKMTIDGKASVNMDCGFPRQVDNSNENKGESSVSEDLSSVLKTCSCGISSLEELSAGEDSLLLRNEVGKPSKRIVKESKRIHFERNSSPSVKEIPDTKEPCQAKDDYVDDIFDILGV